MVSVIEPKEKHIGTIVWMHGLGDTYAGFQQMFEHYVIPKTSKGYRVVLPQAPNMPVTLNGGMVMPSWYDILDTSIFRRAEDKDGINQSCKLITDVLDEEVKRIGSEKVIIGGFSQGGAMAMYTGLGYSKPLAGIISCSAYVLGPLHEEPQRITQENRKTPLLVCHGKMDSMVPFQPTMGTYQKLPKDLPIEFHEGMHDHEVPIEVLEILCEWIPKRLGNDSKL